MLRMSLFTWLAVAVTVPALPSSAGPCDAKSVVGAFWCETDRSLLSKEQLVSDAEHWVCDPCAIGSAKEGKCRSCGKDLVKKTSGKGVCPKCFKKPAPVEACEKNWFVCGKCNTGQAQPGTCPKCQGALERRPALALLSYECAACGSKAKTPGKCDNVTCKAKGQDRLRVCSESGKPPHVSGS